MSPALPIARSLDSESTGTDEPAVRVIRLFTACCAGPRPKHARDMCTCQIRSKCCRASLARPGGGGRNSHVDGVGSLTLAGALFLKSTEVLDSLDQNDG